MGVGLSVYIRRLVVQEARRRVAAAAERGEPLLIPATAAGITQEFPGAALPDEDVRNQLFAEAAQSGVAVELGRRPHGEVSLSFRNGLASALDLTNSAEREL